MNATATAAKIRCGNHSEPTYHESVAEVRACFAGGSPEQREVAAAFSSNRAVSQPARATDRQVEFLLTLSKERGRETTREQAEMLTKKQASDLISTLLTEPKPVERQAIRRFDVPAGRYAVEVEGTLGFFKVDRPTEGRWAGYTFVKQMASDTEYPVRGMRQQTVLGLIEKDPKAASLRYGREIGACGVCGRTLTDEDSRAAGIGPVCASKTGW